jgi:hypothetical protein
MYETITRGQRLDETNVPKTDRCGLCQEMNCDCTELQLLKQQVRDMQEYLYHNTDYRDHMAAAIREEFVLRTMENNNDSR